MALWSPTAASGGFPEHIPEEEEEEEDAEVEAEVEAVPCTARPRRLSGPIVYGRECGVRRRTARRCSRALLFAVDGDEEVAAVAMVTAGEQEEEVNAGGEKRGGEEESWLWW